MWALIFSALKPVLIMIIQLITKKLFELALEVVEGLKKTDLTNEEKRARAFNEIKAIALAKGIDTRDSVINLVLEIAVNYMKDKDNK